MPMSFFFNDSSQRSNLFKFYIFFTRSVDDIDIAQLGTIHCYSNNYNSNSLKKCMRELLY